MEDQTQNPLFDDILGNGEPPSPQPSSSQPNPSSNEQHVIAAPLHQQLSSVDRNKITVIRNVIDHLEESLRTVKTLLQEISGETSDHSSAHAHVANTHDTPYNNYQDANARIVEGVFNGLSMIGTDGKEYAVPANYASKSKLVEGDVLKLIIQPSGMFIYKQIRPVERVRLVGALEREDASGEYQIRVNDHQIFKVLLASVTYFHGQAGDEVVVLVPRDGTAHWAAVENIIKKTW